MSTRKHKRHQQSSFAMVPVWIGICLVGLAVLLVFTSKSKSGSQTSSALGAVHYPAPELSLQNINGETKSLADYRASVVLVNNWATWCPPCKAEMPTLAAYFNKHNADGFMIIAVEAGDSLKDVSQFAQSYGLKFQVWLDPQGASVRAFGNGALPNSYVIDRSGTVRYAWTGAINDTVLEKYVTPLIAEKN